MTLLEWLSAGAALVWISVLLLPWQPWRTREHFSPANRIQPLDNITVLIPARNEADVLAQTLDGLCNQGPGLKVVVIDDQSTDATAAVAHAANLEQLLVIQTPPLPDGWTGKLWALEQGRCRITTDYTLLLDADIRLEAGVVAGLLDRLEHDNLDMISLMARLRMKSTWEKLLLPAFVYFFKLLYPFALANLPGSRVAAAAGGCILMRTRMLENIGGFGVLRTALIDDCTLARYVKYSGGHTWLGLTHAAVSQRRYDDLSTIWQMISRTAYTQLHYSPWRLLLCLLLLTGLFIVPLIGLLQPWPDRWPALIACAGLGMSYLPTLRYYRLHPLRVLTLPAAALLFGLMTLDSARRHYSGHGSLWKGRAYPGTG